MESIESCDEVSKDGTVVREPIGDSWKTQAFILVHPDSPRLDGDALARTSRLTARVDNNAIGDGFQLYLHSFVVNASGEWAVVQQGMNPSSHLARRYHWHSAEVRDFTSNPHAAILGRLRESGNWEGELRHFTKESREVVVSARHQLIVGTDGVERILETNRDITEHKRAEAALREQAELLDLVHDTIMVRGLDGTGYRQNLPRSAPHRLSATRPRLNRVRGSSGCAWRLTPHNWGIFEWTVPTDTAVWENKRMYEIFGIPETTDAVNRDRFVRETLHPEDLPRFHQELEESMQPGALFRGGLSHPPCE